MIWNRNQKSQNFHFALFFYILVNYYYNPHIPNTDAISGALFTLRIQYEYTQTRCDEGARDGIDIWYMGIISDFSFEVACRFEKN